MIRDLQPGRRASRPRWRHVSLQVLGGIFFAAMLAAVELCFVYAVLAVQP